MNRPSTNPSGFNPPKPPTFPQPLDRVALITMAILAMLIAILLFAGDHTLPLVRNFSWQGKQVGVQDRAFILTFNRLMDWSKVTTNLKIKPNLEGKTSWTGRRLAYTLTDPIPYGKSFQVDLANAPEALPGNEGQAKPMRPFAGQFQSRDQAFAYIGVSPAEAGRLVLTNFTRNRKTVLTPADLVVFDFKPTTAGDRILFTAAKRRGKNQPTFDPELYQVSTGIQAKLPGQPDGEKIPAGKISKILDNNGYQILKFDLAGDGQNIVVQRAAKLGSGTSGATTGGGGVTSLWLIRDQAEPQLLNAEAGGDFLVAPDGTTLVMSQGQGVAVLPLDPKTAGQPLDFLPQFGMVLDFARDGSAATMVKFNSDYSRSLFVVTNRGTQKQIARIQGTIFKTYFDPQQRFLYCLLTRVLPGKDYNEQPYIAVIDLKTNQFTPIVDLAGQGELSMSLAPDGSGLIFNQVVNLPTSQGRAPATSSNLWLLPLVHASDADTIKVSPPRPLAAGTHARWLP
jgi:hypothetical protein